MAASKMETVDLNADDTDADKDAKKENEKQESKQETQDNIEKKEESSSSKQESTSTDESTQTESQTQSQPRKFQLGNIASDVGKAFTSTVKKTVNAASELIMSANKESKK